MINILRTPDDIKIYCQENENIDAAVRTELSDGKLSLFVSADKSRPCFICLRWNYRFDKPTRIMGDKWERTYGDMEWHSLNGEIFMPWYFLINCENVTVGCGVKTQPNSFVSFTCDAMGVTGWFDVRCGGKGVSLGGRELTAAHIVCETYEDISAFQAAKNFCKVMCDAPILPKEPVYGSNNWYYAYGESSYDEIMLDADIIASLAGQNENKPYMVIDDGWSVNRTAGPWCSNEKFGDMGKIAREFKAKGVKPGIWIRPLHDIEAEKQHPEWRIKRGERLTYLDPSVPQVKNYLRDLIRTVRGWGYELIKHDFSTFDMFDHWGSSLNGKISPEDDWTFSDETKTSAEIVLDLYRLIREEAGDAVVIGCNTISHLCAGLVELNRIGDDTSGNDWNRTRVYGVNTLAFRLCQNDAFYKVDADCVGIIEGKIDWKLNKQWLHLLANSASPLFVSIEPKALTDEMISDLTDAFKINSVQNNETEPVDWFYNNTPQKWMIDGKLTEYDFFSDSYPALLGRHT